MYQRLHVLLTLTQSGLLWRDLSHKYHFASKQQEGPRDLLTTVEQIRS